MAQMELLGLPARPRQSMLEPAAHDVDHHGPRPADPQILRLCIESADRFRCALECALAPRRMPQPPRLLAPPLRTAVCELRFPRLAQDLSQDQVAALRSALDDYFPYVEERTGVEFRLTPGGLQNQETRTLQLLSPDRNHALTVGAEMFALETSAYETIDDFVEQWRTVAAPVASVFGPEMARAAGNPLREPPIRRPRRRP